MFRLAVVSQIRSIPTKLGASIAAGVGRYRQLLSHRDVLWLIAAGIVSEIGDWFNAVALIALSFDYGDGALGVGGMLALRAVPRLLLQAPAGALVDRWPVKRVLVLSHLAMAIVATAFVVLLAAPELWLLYTLVLALETANTVAWPAYRVQLAQATPPAQFAAVNGLLSILLTGAQFIGPLLGGLVLVGAGEVAVFLVNGLSFAAVALVAARLPEPEAPTDREQHETETRQSPVTQTSDAPHAGAPTGYRWLLRQPELTLFAGAALGATVAIRGAIALFVIRSIDLGLGEAGPGYFYAAVALGAIVGGLVAGAGTHDRPSALRRAAAAMIVCALALIWFGTAESVVLALLALTVAGLATNVYEVLGLTYFQHRLPAGLFGRFMSLLLLALGAGGIVGALAGPLAETSTSVATAMAAISLPGVVLAILLLARLAARPADERPNAND